jgi:hypothetical protein
MDGSGNSLLFGLDRLAGRLHVFAVENVATARRRLLHRRLFIRRIVRLRLIHQLPSR